MGSCARCGNSLSTYNQGMYCHACQEKKREAIANSSKRYYDILDMMDILGLESEEQVRRKARAGYIPGKIPGVRKHLFDRQTIDEWIRNKGRIPSKPANPLQEEAYSLCVTGDHSWLHEDKFYGHAYHEDEEFCDIPNPGVFKRGTKRTCYFCGHIDYIPFC